MGRYRGVTVARSTRERIIARHHGRCAICGSMPPNLTLDHIVPRSKGGTQAETNLQPACPRCNRRKADDLPPADGLSDQPRDVARRDPRTQEDGAMPEPDPTADAAKAEQDAAAKKAEADKAAADAEKAETEKLGEAGKAALDAERTARRESDKARKEAEKAAREAQAKLDEIETAKLSETEKLKKQAEQGEQLAAKATEKLRKANLITALADEGLTGGKAKAAARLLDGVDYDDDDEPTNLKDAIKAATAEYGEDVFKAAKADADPDPTDLHQGARKPVPDDEDAAISALFPQLRPRDELKT